MLIMTIILDQDFVFLWFCIHWEVISDNPVTLFLRTRYCISLLQLAAMHSKTRDSAVEIKEFISAKKWINKNFLVSAFEGKKKKKKKGRKGSKKGKFRLVMPICTHEDEKRNESGGPLEPYIPQHVHFTDTVRFDRDNPPRHPLQVCYNSVALFEPLSLHRLQMSGLLSYVLTDSCLLGRSHDFNGIQHIDSYCLFYCLYLSMDLGLMKSDHGLEKRYGIDTNVGIK